MLSELERQLMWERYKRGTRDEIETRVVRGTVEPGRTFSPDALEEVRDTLWLFVGARMQSHWERRNEPPTIMTVRLSVSFG